MKIYRGDIKNMRATGFDLYEGTKILQSETVVVKKDAPFYEFFGKKISFDYNTFLAPRDEATGFLKETLEANPTSGVRTCLFVDYDELVPEEISKEQYKQMKKTYREQRKNRR